MQTHEFAASVLLTNSTIASRYLENSPSHVANKVQLDFELLENFKITDFYFDQVLLVLQIEDETKGSRQLEFFNYAQGKYLHLEQVKAKQYTDSHLIVDDRRSNNKLYRVVQFGYPSDDPDA